jgi:hypothetical protein
VTETYGISSAVWCLYHEVLAAETLCLHAYDGPDVMLFGIPTTTLYVLSADRAWMAATSGGECQLHLG